MENRLIMDNKNGNVCKRTASTASEPSSRKRVKKSFDQLNNPCEVNDSRIPEYVSNELKDHVPDIMGDLGVSPVLARVVQSYIPLADIEQAVVHLITKVLLPPLRYVVTKRFPNTARSYYERYAELFENDEEGNDCSSISDINESDDDNISRRELMLECNMSDNNESSADFVVALDMIRSDLIENIVRKMKDPSLMKINLPKNKVLILCMRIYALVIGCIKPALSTFLVEDEDFITKSFNVKVGSEVI